MVGDRSRFPRALEALGDLLDWVEDVARGLGVDEPGCRRAQLVAEELFMNHLRHQPGTGPIEIGIEPAGPGVFSLELVDAEAVEFDPRGVRDPRLDQAPGERESGGMGLELIRQLSKRVDYAYEAGTAVTRVTLGVRADEIEGTAG